MVQEFDDQIKKAINLGFQINVNTECQQYLLKLKIYRSRQSQEGKGFDPRKLLADGTQAVIDKVEEKIDMFGSENSAK